MTTGSSSSSSRGTVVDESYEWLRPIDRDNNDRLLGLPIRDRWINHRQRTGSSSPARSRSAIVTLLLDELWHIPCSVQLLRWHVSETLIRKLSLRIKHNIYNYFKYPKINRLNDLIWMPNVLDYQKFKKIK